MVLHGDGAQGDNLESLGLWVCEARCFGASWHVFRGDALEVTLRAERRSQFGQITEKQHYWDPSSG